MTKHLKQTTIIKEIMNDKTLQKYVDAGRIAAEALHYGKSLIVKGAKVIEILDKVEKKIEELGLGDHVQEIAGKKAVQVAMGRKDQKKLKKGFPELEFDASNACVLPDEAQITLMDIIFELKTLDVMKFAITKLYNPLAGKALRSKVT